MENPAHGHLQVEHTADIIDPGHALQAKGFFAQWIDTHRGNTLLNGLLKDVRLGYLDEGRVDGRRVGDGSIRGGCFFLLVGSHAESIDI